MSKDDFPRLLLIVSNDFGELANLLYFIERQPFEVMLALPPRLYLIHGSSLSVFTQEYRTTEQLFQIADRFRPQVVLLGSGYLFGVNGLFDPPVLAALVAGLKQRGGRVVTTDPFLGLFAEPGQLTLANPHPQTAALLDHFKHVAQALASLPHLYPAKVPESARVTSFCFFNESIAVRTPHQFSDRTLPLRPDTRRWLFVLSAEDCNLQTLKMGDDRLIEWLNKKLGETASAGRQAVLVAPQALIDRIEKLVDPAGQAILQPLCSLTLFQALLLEAEYAFFWNIYSNSIFHRVANGLPVIFFDVGHIAYALPALHQRAKPAYYGTAPLPMLPADEPLKLDTLALLADQQRAPLAATMAGYRELPAPAEVIRSILTL